MFGQILINFLFACAVVTTGAYFLSYRDNEVLRNVARTLFIVIFGGLLLASVLQFINIFGHDFRYFYVYNYSNTELSKPLLMATFYAGQEGSFMLWTILVSLIGVLLLPYVRRVGYESEVMSFYSLILVFLMLMMVAKNPFAYIWEHFAAEATMTTGFTPANGRGLNPLLHNLWITIHPPMLFTGFAALSVPFAFAMAGLVRRDFHRWVSISLPWTLLGTAILGFGIMLGGFWAYETLGWGGFWGWDPVENSSLIPWLVCVALVHTMLTQKKTRGLVKTNFFLAITAFILVLYSTFLTRSGVLGDTSVHSFVDPGMFAFVLLIVFMTIFGLLGYGAIVWRWKDISGERADFRMSSREFGLAMGATAILFSASTVLFGTSWPIMAEVIGQPKIDPGIAFYNKVHLPLVIIIGLVNALSLLVNWRSTGRGLFLRRLMVPLGIAAVATLIVTFFGLRDVSFIVLAFASFLSLFVNLELAVRLLRRKPKMIGAYVSHFGISLLFLGIIATASFSVMEHVRLERDMPVSALGLQFTYLGKEQVDKEFKDREKYQYHIEIASDNHKSIVKPVLYWSDYNRRQSAFLEPGIQWSLNEDVYIAPKVVEVEGESPTLSMQKLTPQPMPLDSSYTITLQRFDMSQAMGADPNASELRLGVEIEIAHGADTSRHSLYSSMATANQSWRYEPYNIPGTDYHLSLRQIVPNRSDLSRSEALIAFVDSTRPETQEREVFTVEVSIKPFINLVWLGVILMVCGFAFSIVRRIGEIRPDWEAAKADRTKASTVPESAKEHSNGVTEPSSAKDLAE